MRTEHDCTKEGIIDDLKKDIYGNGKPGLKTVVTEMKTDILWIKRIGISIIVLLTGNLATMISIFVALGNK